MMSNIDVMTLIKYLISSFTCCFGFFLTSIVLLYKDIRDIKWYNYIFILIASIVIVYNSLIFDNIFKLFGIILILFLLFKKIYNADISTSLVVTIITYIIFPLSESIFILVLAILNYIFNLNLIMEMIKTFIGNFVIVSISIGIAFIVRKNINSYLNKIDKTNIIYIIILGIISILSILASLFKLYTNGWKFDYIFILNIFVVLGCVTLIMVLIKQHIKNIEIADKYRLTEEYIKTSAEVVEKYSATIHKYKNNLIVLKGYLNSDIKQANEYIDKLLDNYKDKKYSWFNKINYIQINPVRYLIYYKLTKAEEKNLKISVNVSGELKKVIDFKCDINILLDMIGEYFDNAIYASNESLEKQLILDLFLENDKIVFIITNTYKEKFDVKSITKNGYTTKGHGHGFGLYEIDKIIKKNEFINCNYEVIDNYFIVNLSINVIFKDNK